MLVRVGREGVMVTQPIVERMWSEAEGWVKAAQRGCDGHSWKAEEGMTGATAVRTAGWLASLDAKAAQLRRNAQQHATNTAKNT